MAGSRGGRQVQPQRVRCGFRVAIELVRGDEQLCLWIEKKADSAEDEAFCDEVHHHYHVVQVHDIMVGEMDEHHLRARSSGGMHE